MAAGLLESSKLEVIDKVLGWHDIARDLGVRVIPVEQILGTVGRDHSTALP